ncbi:Fatty acid desaturase [Roseateles sp. YR242]|uniref:fatty acid desaturase family protein n=1 Tax=Roseateles sp. YR242 TaxID=1855305 RepID=UPI0008C40C9E|nr:fatty acid desaturase [Roseateles sp. YR242]SEL52461.1 Fatty acid desaturase [Roseateles sp. YR242]
MRETTQTTVCDGTAASIKALHQVPRLRNAVRLFLLLLLYGGLAVLACRSGIGWGALAVLAMGLILAGLLNAAHDCVHLRLTGNRRVDAAIGQWLCAPLLINFPDFRQAHLRHHQHARGAADTEWTGVFTSRQHYLRYLFLGNPLRGQWRVWRMFGPPAREGDGVVRSTHVLLLALLAMAPAELLLCWAAPYVIGHVFIRFFSLPEHYGLVEQADVGSMTRSVRSVALVRFLLWEASFHAEHHRWPGVPSLNLPALHALKAMALPHLYPGYLRFHHELYLSLPQRSKR